MSFLTRTSGKTGKFATWCLSLLLLWSTIPQKLKIHANRSSAPRKLRFEVTVIEEGCRGINLDGSIAAAWKQLEQEGVSRVIFSEPEASATVPQFPRPNTDSVADASGSVNTSIVHHP